MNKSMNEQKKSYIKPAIVFEDFQTGEMQGTPEMIERYRVGVLDILDSVNNDLGERVENVVS